MKRTILIGSMIVFLMMPVAASAALLELEYQNAYTTDEVHFSIADVTSTSDIYFYDFWVFSPSADFAASGWSDVITDSGHSLDYHAPDSTAILPTSGSFSFWLHDGNYNWSNTEFDFTLRWEEYNDGVLQGQGDIAFVDGVPTPLPASAWMLLSGLAMFVGVRRRNAG